jgi:tetratricopeptide (TPR) repeat protein
MSETGRKRLRRAVWILIAVLVLLLAFELLFRGHVLRHAFASGLYGRGRFAQAEKIWQNAADPKDKDHIPESSLGSTLYQKGDYPASEGLFNSALIENGKVHGNHYNLGNAYYREDKLDPALESYKRAMLLDPGDNDAKSNYELVLKRKGYQPPPEQEPQGGGNREKPEEQKNDSQASPEDQEEIRNRLDALDQQEARERMAREAPKSSDKGGKWW